MNGTAASERSIPQGVLELIERNSDCVRRRMVFGFGVVGLVPSLENTKNKDLTLETPLYAVRYIVRKNRGS